MWKVLLFGMVICDTAHVYAIGAEMGLGLFLSPGDWRFEDWVTMITTAGPIFLRMAFILDVGVGGEDKDQKKA